MTLAITLARLSRRICQVPRLHRLGYVTENALTKKAWEDAVQGLGKRRVSLLHRTVTGFWQKISVKKAFSQNEKSGWPVAPLSHWSFVVMPGRKDSPLPVRRLTRSTGKKNASISRLQARNTSHGLSCHFEYEAGPEQKQAWQSSLQTVKWLTSRTHKPRREALPVDWFSVVRGRSRSAKGRFGAVPSSYL